jgi:tripartite motif-containing protein 71
MHKTLGPATKAVARCPVSLVTLKARRRTCAPLLWRFPILLVVALVLGVAPESAPPLRAAESKLPQARFLLTWGKRGAGPGAFHFPIGIAITPADEILVTDHYNNRVQTFTTEGKLLSHFPVLPNPGGIALDKSGNIYLSHFPASVIRRKEVNPDRLTVYSAAGKRLHEWGKTGAGNGEFNYPGGMVIAPNGRLYVADQTNHRIQMLDLHGQFLGAWGKHGTKPGEFGGHTNVKSRAGGPDFVALDERGNFYTTEAMDGRVQKFTAEGVFLLAFGDLKDRPGSFGREFKPIPSMHGPIGICCDRHDRLWISTAGGRIQQFTSEGRYLRGFGEDQGTEPGQFLAPHGLAVDSRGYLYVVDAYNHRIQKVDVGGQ